MSEPEEVCGAQHEERPEVVCERRGGPCVPGLDHLSRTHRVRWGGGEVPPAAAPLLGRDALAGILARSSSGVRTEGAAEVLGRWAGRPRS